MREINKILVVDDDEIVRYLVKEIIEEAGIATSIIDVADGAEGLEYLITHCVEQEDCPELILLDINMPDVDGFEFLNLKNSLPEVKNIPSKIVMISSSSRQSEIQKAKELGAIDYITKPLTREKILRAIEKISA